MNRDVLRLAIGIVKYYSDWVYIPYAYQRERSGAETLTAYERYLWAMKVLNTRLSRS